MAYDTLDVLHIVSRDDCISASSSAAEVYAVKLRFYGQQLGEGPLTPGAPVRLGCAPSDDGSTLDW